MDQITLGLDPLPKKTRKEVCLDEMNQVVPWAALVSLIQPQARGAHQALVGRPPFPIETMVRIHCLQLWWNLSDPAMEEELHERPQCRRFAGLEGAARMPDETTILRFRHLLVTLQSLAAINTGLAQQGLMLKTGTVVDAMPWALQHVGTNSVQSNSSDWRNSGAQKKADLSLGMIGPRTAEISLLLRGRKSRTPTRQRRINAIELFTFISLDANSGVHSSPARHALDRHPITLRLNRRNRVDTRFGPIHGRNHGPIVFLRRRPL